MRPFARRKSQGHSRTSTSRCLGCRHPRRPACRGSGAAQPAERGARDLGERRLVYRPSGKHVAHDVCRLDGPPVLQIHADERAVDDVRAVDDEMCCVSSARSKN